MKLAAVVAALLTLAGSGVAASQTQNEALPRPMCLSSDETRDLFIANKLVQPFRVMRDASRIAQAEAIDIQLCRTQGVLVYDVTLLDRDGRVIHKLVSAISGAALSDRGKTPLTEQEQDDRQGPKPADRALDQRSSEPRGN